MSDFSISIWNCISIVVRFESIRDVSLNVCGCGECFASCTCALSHYSLRRCSTLTRVNLNCDSPKRYKNQHTIAKKISHYVLGLLEAQGLDVTPPNLRRGHIFSEKSIAVACLSVSEGLRTASALCAASSNSRAIREQNMHVIEAENAV